MRVKDLKKEQEQAQEAAWEIEKQIKRERAQHEQREIEKTISIDLDRGAFLQFLETTKNGSLRRVYGMGGCYYIHDQIVVAQEFFRVALRDRNQIEELITEEYVPNRINSIKLSLNVDPEFVRELKQESASLGVDYMAYLRGIFYTRAMDINTEQRAINEERERAFLFDSPRKIEGYISKELRDKLEEKFGECKWNTMFCTAIYGHFDMLIDLAEEYFGIQKK